ncbi:hypothetical protein CGCA056_v011156 [Colletotrichum aenigma]|uniref:uncharacterized protein n=1 Tax=Colletotrichum aenigma TaxID=1215731 RepID=UPI0018731C83|nr:uncharacterized protein CGCA056_v011156 [Colletotrichum aenigma]KAF5517514.1 hypothetical protein CGCA056_v011156 [Colletotrichum aenigma]
MNHEKGKLAEADAYSNPPPYPGNNAELPDYETPRFNNTASDTRLVAATARFPPILNCYYQWKWKQVYYLGPSAEEKMFAISFDGKLFSTKQTLCLHNGPSDKAPVMATASRTGMGWHDRSTINVNREFGSGEDIKLEKPQDAGFRKSQVRAFHMKTTKGRVEEFQWRTSHGNEIKELAGHASGWKLVRMMGPESIGGHSKNPDLGYSSDGQEVVAVLAHNMSWSMTKGYRFAFMGTGLTGTLGEEWEATAVLTGFWLWYQQVTTNSAAGAGAAGAAAC